MKIELPLSLKLICGAIGKEYVIKHYKDGVVKTKYPDMSGIIATVRQRKCRNLFKEAVAYAKEVIADMERKACWQKKLRKRNSVYNAAIKEYMLREKKKKEGQFIETNRQLRNAWRKHYEENDIVLNKTDIAKGIDTRSTSPNNFLEDLFIYTNNGNKDEANERMNPDIFFSKNK